MAELATIARPYAEAAFAAVRESGIPSAQAADALDQIAQIAADPALREVMGSPKVSARLPWIIASDEARMRASFSRSPT